jgi:hypothetical protein
MLLGRATPESLDGARQKRTESGPPLTRMHRNQGLMINAKVGSQVGRKRVSRTKLAAGLHGPFLRPEVALTDSALTQPLHGGATIRSAIWIVGSSVSCRSINGDHRGEV